MCGLIAVFNTQIKKNKEVNDSIIQLYEDQYKRGTEGFGIIRINNKKKIEIDRACEPTKFLLDLYFKKSKMIIAHHRTPTSTDNTMDQTHPMVIKNDLLKHDYYVIHNGMITNDAELRQKHLELGFEYQTQCFGYPKYGVQTEKLKWNDSEAIAIELALFIEGKISAIGTENNAAFIILQSKKGKNKAEKVFFGKNGEYADLTMNKTKGQLTISSEGSGDDVEPGKLYSFHVRDIEMELSDKPIEFKKKEIPKIEAPKTTAPLNLPVTTTDNNMKINPLRYRSWVNRSWVKDIAEDDPIDYADLPEYAGKDYIKDLCIDFKEKLKEADTNGITHLIDDTLDEEMEKINSIVLEYKNILMNDVLESGEEEFYTDQVKRMLTGMKAVTNMADRDYTDKEIAEDDFESYNGAAYTLSKKGKEAIEFTVNGREELGWNRWENDPEDVDPRGMDIYEDARYNRYGGPRE